MDLCENEELTLDLVSDQAIQVGRPAAPHVGDTSRRRVLISAWCELDVDLRSIGRHLW